MTDAIYCPVEGCDYWVAISGYTEKVIRHLKTHVARDHRDLSSSLTRRDGGIVDGMVAEALEARVIPDASLNTAED